MGMAYVEPKKPRKPRYTGTVVCLECDAEYAPGNWLRGFRSGGTDGRFYATSKVPDDHCPICGAKRPQNAEQVIEQGK